MKFALTPKQREAWGLISGDAAHILLSGGSRSGKTFLIIRAIVIRALTAAGSRHAVLRFRFAHIMSAVVFDTFPKVMQLCFPEVPYTLNKREWFAEFPNRAQIWFGGLDDKERTEKILGSEYASIFLNECSQIPFPSRSIAVTRLAQNCTAKIDGVERPLRLKMYYDANPPSTAHWTHLMFVQKRDPETKKPLEQPAQYATMSINPIDNSANLPREYIRTLEQLPARMRLRFLEGKYADATAGALFTLEMIEAYRHIESLPDMQRIVVAVDPSGSGDDDAATHDAIGIVVAGLGVDGNAYVIEDLTCQAGPRVWGNIATTAYDRHAADLIVGEANYGGDMVRYVVQAAKPGVPYRKVTASRGKVVRAEPVSALVEKGKVRFAGHFHELEDELCSFTTAGYTGSGSPNRADALVWAISELFPGIAKRERAAKRDIPKPRLPYAPQPAGWLGA